MDIKRFHISLPCKDISATKKFYSKELGFEIGRRAHNWFDLNLFGNQITFTFDDKSEVTSKKYSFEDIQLPIFHFGIILDQDSWTKYHKKFQKKEYFAIGSTKFLSNQIGHHKSFFIIDNNGYFIEFKAFFKEVEIFERDQNKIGVVN